MTRSPSAKPRVGTKLAPCALAYERRLPLWLPLREPTTETLEISLAGAPTKLICVAGEASSVPFNGEIVTALAAVAHVVSAANETSSTRPPRTACVRLPASPPIALTKGITLEGASGSAVG